MSTVRWLEFDPSVLDGDEHDAIAVSNEIRRITVTSGMSTRQFINALAAESNRQPPGWRKSMMSAVTALWMMKIFKDDDALRADISKIAVSHWEKFTRETNAQPFL